MAPAKKAAAKAAKPAPKEVVAPADAGAADLQAIADTNTSQGYWGTTNDPHPNEAYSLASGPESPTYRKEG